MNPETQSYAWEEAFEKGWQDNDGVQYTDTSDLTYRTTLKILEQQLERRAGAASRHFCLLRHLFIILDVSRRMHSEVDFSPNRLSCAVKLLKDFASKFFSNNPIGQIGIITTSHGKCRLACNLTSSLQTISNCLEEYMNCGRLEKQHAKSQLPFIFSNNEKMNPADFVDKSDKRDVITLQQSLDAAASILRHSPSGSSKEILLVTGSLGSVDPGDILNGTLPLLKNVGIQCYALSMAAECRILQHLCDATLISKTEIPTNQVILDVNHMEKVLSYISITPAFTANNKNSFVRLAYPTYVKCHPVQCMSHSMGTSHNKEFKLSCYVHGSKMGFRCPGCHAIYCMIPIECRICGLALVSGEHIARTFQQSKPFGRMLELKVPPQGYHCDGCDSFVVSQSNAHKYNPECVKQNCKYLLKCLLCKWIFCPECDSVMRNIVRECPGCCTLE
ncbi:hypothetical protein ACOME3_004142 [Neoechinorhynchus agilis]